MFFVKGTVIGEDLYGNLKKKLINRKEPEKPNMARFIDEADISGLVNVKLALLDMYEGTKKIDEIEFMSDDVDSCEADELSSL